MKEELKNLLVEEIKSEIQDLSSLSPGSKEKSTAIEDLAQLYKLKIEESKLDIERTEKIERRVMDMLISAVIKKGIIYEANVYEFVIRLFSKVPFLQYNFKAEQKPMTIEQRIDLDLSKSLRRYHNCVKQKVDSIEQLLQLSDYIPNDGDLDAEISVLIGGKE